MSKSRVSIVKVALSTPILARTRCPFCNSLPNAYYVLSNGPLEISPRKIINIFARYKNDILTSFNSYNFVRYEPKYFVKMSDFSHKTFYKKFRPQLHSMLKFKYHQFSNVNEYLSCDCGRSHWAFTFKSIVGRPDLAMRKSSKFFSQKFPG